MFTSAVNKRTGSFSRALGVLLILFILCGTTVEAVHRHGGVVSSNSSATSLVDEGQTKSTTNGKASCSDCLICQLHQNFSTTLISVRPNTDSLTQQVISSGVDPVVVRSISQEPKSGRAHT